MSATPPEDNAVKSIQELFKTMITTAGIMLPLLWGLTQRSQLESVITIIRIASIVLMVSIAASLLGCQFIVTKLEKRIDCITKEKSVAFSFLAAWVTFIGGCVLVIVALFRIN